MAPSWLIAAVVVLPYSALASSDAWAALPNIITGKKDRNGGSDEELFEADTTPWVEQIAVKPRAYYFHNFLTHHERAHIIRLAAPMLKRSTVAGTNGSGEVADIRTSYGMFIPRLHDPVIMQIERRIALWTHLPLEHQESIQVLRYGMGQTYGAHFDSNDRESEPGPKWRLATFLMYLSDVEEGGETAFPNGSQWADPALGRRLDASFSPCAKGHVAARPKAGDAVLFYSYFPNNTMDPAGKHTGCPVIKGVKWAAPVWMHHKPFRPEEVSAGDGSSKDGPGIDYDPGMCEDLHEKCAKWAAEGACHKNVEYMVGGKSGGMCRKSCDACEPCRASDYGCKVRNRERGGYWKFNFEELKHLGVDVRDILGDAEEEASEL